MKEAKHIFYFLPCKPGSVYMNLTDKCLNECLFCIKRGGPFFFGSDLSLASGLPTVGEIVAAFHSIDKKKRLKEVVFCGMGEPLLEYHSVLECCREIRRFRSHHISIRVDTSGLVWATNKRLDILPWIDELSISLNAENAEKYEELCRPRISRAFDVLMEFLRAVKTYEVDQCEKGGHLPRVRLSIVDTSEEEFIPVSGRVSYAPGTFPVPDFNECQKIADGFGWPLIVKRLFRDSCDEIWSDPAIQEMCAQGIEIERCKNCTYRH